MVAGVVVSSVAGGALGLTIMLAAEQGMALQAMGYFSGGVLASLGFGLRAMNVALRG